MTEISFCPINLYRVEATESSSNARKVIFAPLVLESTLKAFAIHQLEKNSSYDLHPHPEAAKESGTDASSSRKEKKSQKSVSAKYRVTIFDALRGSRPMQFLV